MKKNTLIGLILGCLILFSCEQTGSSEEEKQVENQPTLFRLLDPDQTGISFTNTIQESLNLNVLMYEYLYNGGGVAVGDLNQDGLEDIYFSANISGNQLYLNQGNLKFEEVSEISQAKGRSGPWKTGVVFVDINGDGKLDIYQCYSGALPPEKRRNQLFVNQGNNENGVPIFKEMAAEFGIDSPSTSTSASFFDFDRDGDLDLFLLNHNTRSIQNQDVKMTQNLLLEKHEAGSQLFENQGGKFVEITEKAGISSSSLSYGLGVAVTDFDEDGWPDIYIGNDYSMPDYLYINQKDGTFKDEILERLDHVSHFSMGNDVADVNNDGHLDLFTLDMLPEGNERQKLLLSPDNFELFQLNIDKGFHHQYMRNMLHVSTGNGRYQELAQLAGIANTDWSWSALFADFDNDGWKDLFVSNGYLRDYNNQDFLKYMDNYIQTSGGQLKRENVLELVKSMPSSNLTNYIYSNSGDLTFENKTESWGMDHAANSNGAVYADLDNDGDLDLVVNNINSPAFIYQNLTDESAENNFLKINLKGEKLNYHALGAEIRVYIGNSTQLIAQNSFRGFQSSVSPVLHLGLGKATKIDSLEIRWPSGKSTSKYEIAANQTLELTEAEEEESVLTKRTIESPVFKEKDLISIPKSAGINDFKRQPLLPHPISENGKAMVQADFNGDGREDLFVGGDAGVSGRLYFQNNSGDFSTARIAAFEAAKSSEDTDALAIDVNEDGYLDLIVASGGVGNFNAGDQELADRVYLNDGKGNFELLPDAIPGEANSTGSILSADFNFDGKPDLLVGGRVIPGQYPLSPGAKVFINDGTGRFSDQTEQLAPELLQLGMMTDSQMADLDLDGKEELIVVGDAMPISVFAYKSESWTNVTSDYFESEQVGFWNHVQVKDWDGDGKLEIFAGNLGLNTQIKASESAPAELLYGDFDNNGSTDVILGYAIAGKKYPSASRDEILGQVNFLKKRFLDFKSFAQVEMKDLFTEAELNGSKTIQINTLQTSYFALGSANKFENRELPLEVQFSPVYTSHSMDVNNDGNLDLIIGGNIKSGKLKFGKQDANQGLVLVGNGKGEFRALPQLESGLSIRGDVRAISNLNNQLVFLVKSRGLIIYEPLLSNK